MTRTLAALTIVLAAHAAHGMDLDAKLELVKQVYGLAAKDCEVPKRTKAEIAAGQVLFESRALAGNRDTSCATCHVDKFGSADGLPIAVGVGGEGEGEARYAHGQGILVQRNALSMIGRGSSAFRAFFWDGRVQEQNGRIVSQFGELRSPAFTSTLAVAAVLPFLERDEFLGQTRLLADNDIQQAVGDRLYQQRYVAVSAAIKQRLLNPETEEDRKAAQALTSTGVDLKWFELANVGNLLAVHIATKFKCKESRWDSYLRGNRAALSTREKEGAVLFYGKGRCAACHAGPFLSDFDFHGIATPHGSFGPHSRHRDIGRAHVTTRVEDLNKFRTPPLIQVTSTPPYGHNGSFQTMREVVVHHFNPLEFYRANPAFASTDFYEIGKLLQARDEVLGSIDLSREDELQAVLSFLETL